jgi:hypothetical protein
MGQKFQVNLPLLKWVDPLLWRIFSPRETIFYDS